MAKVTSKLQLTIPKAVADEYRIRPGDEVQLVPSGGFIRMTPPLRRREDLTAAERAKLFSELFEQFRNRRKGQSKVRGGKGPGRSRARLEA